MRTRSIVILTTLLAAAGRPASAQSCTWGGFDASRLEHPTIALDGAEHDTIRAALAAKNVTLAPLTPTLDAAFLATIDVFYTSMIDDGPNGYFSAAEKADLMNWLSTGKTLIVTCEYKAIAQQDDLLAPFGITTHAIQSQGVVPTIAAHPLTAGVTNVRYVADAALSLSGNALTLANNTALSPLIAVLDASTGYSGGGRVIVTGDHNMFGDSYIQEQDNLVLLDNIIDWSCSGGCTGSFTSGQPGCLGFGGQAPVLTGFGCPAGGQQASLVLTGAQPGATSFLLFGLGTGAVPVHANCTLSIGPIVPQLVLPIPTGPNGTWTLTTIMPTTLTGPGDVHVQVAVHDTSTLFGVAASNSVQLHIEP